MTDEVKRSNLLSSTGWDVENYYTNHFYSQTKKEKNLNFF